MTNSNKKSVETAPSGFSKIPREDLPLLFHNVRNNLEKWINNKDQIGKTLSKDNWDEWNQFFEWDKTINFRFYVPYFDSIIAYKSLDW